MSTRVRTRKTCCEKDAVMEMKEDILSDYFVYKSYGVKNSYQFCQIDKFRINFY